MENIIKETGDITYKAELTPKLVQFQKAFYIGTSFGVNSRTREIIKRGRYNLRRPNDSVSYALIKCRH